MEILVNSQQMKTADNNTINNYHIPSVVLMERAALSVYDVIAAHYPRADKILVMCGNGNNGGDGLAVARLFAENHISCDIFMINNTSKMSPETLQQYNSCVSYNIQFVDKPDYSKYNLVIDALIGIGLNNELNDLYTNTVISLNEAKEVYGFNVLSIDIPTGISADTGKVMRAAVKADITVTFAFKKLGHILYPGAEYCNKLILRQIGININAFESGINKAELVYSHTCEELPPVHRSNYSNKGSFGKCLIIAGSRDIPGCAILCSRACFAAGAGMVRIFTHENNRDLIVSAIPEAIVDTYNNFNEDILKKSLEWCDVIAIGPGISTEENAVKIFDCVLNESNKPLVIDADAISIFAKFHTSYTFSNRSVIFTPHIGEMSRLCMKDKQFIANNLLETARSYAQKVNAVIVLKDTRTVTASKDMQCRINSYGNNGLATAGSGDVLTGIILSLIGQNLSAFDAASYGVFIHALAGDKAADKHGRSGMLPSNIIEELKCFFE